MLALHFICAGENYICYHLAENDEICFTYLRLLIVRTHKWGAACVINISCSNHLIVFNGSAPKSATIAYLGQQLSLKMMWKPGNSLATNSLTLLNRPCVHSLALMKPPSSMPAYHLLCALSDSLVGFLILYFARTLCGQLFVASGFKKHTSQAPDHSA